MNMQDDRRYQLRAARDRLIDCLYSSPDEGAPRPVIGFSFPLRDLPVEVDPEVSFGNAATVKIHFSQKGVKYALYKHNPDRGHFLNLSSYELNAEGLEGNGSTIEIESTPLKKETIYFRVKAVKSGKPLNNVENAYFLDETVFIRVREYIFIPGSVLDSQTTVVDYGEPVRPIHILNSREHLSYYFIDAELDAVEAVNNNNILNKDKKPIPGTGVTINGIETEPITRDTTIRIVGVDKQESLPLTSPGQLAFMEQELIIYVRPDHDKIVETPSGYQSIDFGGQTKVRIQDPEAGVEYALYAAPLRDKDFVYVNDDPRLAPGMGLIKLDVNTTADRYFEGFDGAGINKDENEIPYQFLATAKVNPAESELIFDIPQTWEEDTIFHVSAIRQHHREMIENEAGKTAQEKQKLRQLFSKSLIHKAIALAGPNPAVVVEAPVGPLAVGERGVVRLSNTQPGVIYQLKAGEEVIDYFLHDKDKTIAAFSRDRKLLEGDYSYYGVDFPVGNYKEAVTQLEEELGDDFEHPFIRLHTKAFEEAGIFSFQLFAVKALSGITIPIESASIEFTVQDGI